MAKSPNQRPAQNNSPEPSEAHSVVNESLGLDLDNLDGDQGDDDGDNDEVLEAGDEEIQRSQEDDSSDEADLSDEQPARDPLVDLTARVSHTEQQPSPLPKLTKDKRGNLVDAKGKIVARAGAEARFYYTAHKARNELTQVRTAATAQVRDVASRLERAVAIGTEVATELEKVRGEQKFIADLQLNSDEAREAASLYAEGKKDPVSVIRKLLTRAAARGIDITQLGVQGTGLDAKALLEMVQGELAKGLNPLREREAAETRQRQTEEQQTKARDKVTAEVSTFFQTTPKAVAFMKVFEDVMANPANAGMTLNHIWDKIQLNLLNTGKTVDGVIAELRRGKQRGAPDNRRSIPRGRGQPQYSGNEGDDSMAPISASFDDILKGVLKHHQFGRSDV